MGRKNKTLVVRVGFGTDRGLVRELNEDSFCVYVPFEDSWEIGGFQALLGVADGMGGHKAGDLASKYVTDQINSAFIQGNYKAKYERLNDLSLILKNQVREINTELYTMSKRSPGLDSLGSTLTLGIIRDSTLYLVHVGDSRCYCIRGRMIEQLTKEHSWVAEQLSSGVLTREEAAGHPQHNIITQAIGYDPNIEPQVMTKEVRPGDKYVFCTDGLTNHVSDGEIMETVNRNFNPQRACDALIGLARQRGGEDNITIVLGYVQDALTNTAKEIVDFPESSKKRRKRMPLLQTGFKKIIFAAPILLLAATIFAGGVWFGKRDISKGIKQLLDKSEVYYRTGQYDQAFLLLEAAQKIDNNNKQVKKLLLKFKEKKTDRRGGEK